MSLSTQQQIIQNSEEIKNMIGDISKWEDEIKAEDEKLSSKHVPENNDNDDNCKKALALKDKGNKLYSEGKWIEAVRVYSDAILLDTSNAILPANRAMAHIKLENFVAAEADCTLSLSINPDYVKALLRRATARNRLEKYNLAAEDYNKVLKIEPWNKEAKKETENLKSKLSQPKEEKENENKIIKSKQEYESTPGRHRVQFLSKSLKSSQKNEYKKLLIRDVNKKTSIPST